MRADGWADRLTDKYDEVNGRFSQFCKNAQKKGFLLQLFLLKKDVSHYPKQCNIFKNISPCILIH